MRKLLLAVGVVLAVLLTGYAAGKATAAGLSGWAYTLGYHLLAPAVVWLGVVLVWRRLRRRG